jgi:hypothetical protein
MKTTQQQTRTHHPAQQPREIRVYWVQTFEPIEEMIMDVSSFREKPILYSTREEAERRAQEYNEDFGDHELAHVLEIKVR